MKEDSYMIVIPNDDAVVKDPKIFLERLKSSEFITLDNVDFKDGYFEIDLKVEERPYTIWVSPDDIDIPDYVRMGHLLTKEEIKVIQNAKVGIAVSFTFEGDCRVCFHDQLRIIDAMIPKYAAVLDCPSEKLLSGKWVSLAAKSKVQPAARYIFTAQAVSEETGEVWLHTHGLKRCGMYELEILCLNKESYSEYYPIIENLAVRMIESDEPVEPGDPTYIARFYNGKILVVTAVDWKEALKHYPEATLGTAIDRNDDVHSDDTYVVMAYRNPHDAEKHIYTPVQEYSGELKNNPMFLYSNEETERMRSLAAERIEYLRKGFELPDSAALAKIGLIVDDKYQNEENDGIQREHIWFEIKDIGENTVTAMLTQEPYYVSGIKKGDVRTYPFTDITDWIVMTKRARITPDDAYLLV